MFHARFRSPRSSACTVIKPLNWNEPDTGRSRGFGFVEMADDGQAQTAINSLNQKDFGGRALVVNVGRGPVVDPQAVLAEAGRLSFALDVTEPEPLPDDDPLWSAPGVLITPHIAGGTTAMLPRMAALVRDQLERLRDGEPLRNVVER